MKKLHIVGLIAIAVAIGMIMTMYADFDTTRSFAHALAHPNEKCQISGDLLEPETSIYYEPTKDPNYMTFKMRDKAGAVKTVVFYGPEPQDFRRSEQVTIIGQANSKGEIVADEVLMKCPSKYNEEDVKVKSAKAVSQQVE